MDKLSLIDFSKYVITKDGKIWSYTKKRYMKQCSDRLGYSVICLICVDKKPRVFLYHRVIWFYFNGEIPEGLEINHKDEDKSNNALENLELLTRKENVNYGTRTDRAIKASATTRKGRPLSEKHRQALINSKPNPIIQYDLETKEPIKEYFNIAAAARENNFNKSTIRQCCEGKYFDKRNNKWYKRIQAYGFGWRYKNTPTTP